MATDREQLGEHSTTETPQISEMASINIATEGDVIFVLQQTRLRVSSVILSSASPVFKAMFGPNYAEGQGQRSVGEPREVPLFDDDPCAMARLCRLLHHQPDQEAFPHGDPHGQIVKCAQEFYTLTGLADKYACADSLRMVGGYLLSQFGARSVSDGLPLEGTLALIAAAYTIGDSRYFALFTRFLVLDTIVNYSTLIKHQVFENLPNSFLLLVEEQRRAVFNSFEVGLLNLGVQYCKHCLLCTNARVLRPVQQLTSLKEKFMSLGGADPVFMCQNLRIILKEAYRSDKVILHDCPKKRHTLVVDGDGFKSLCDKTSKAACGLCLICLEDTEGDATCTHLGMLQQWTENDPIF